MIDIFEQSHSRWILGSYAKCTPEAPRTGCIFVAQAHQISLGQLGAFACDQDAILPVYRAAPCFACALNAHLYCGSSFARCSTCSIIAHANS